MKLFSPLPGYHFSAKSRQPSPHRAFTFAHCELLFRIFAIANWELASHLGVICRGIGVRQILLTEAMMTASSTSSNVYAIFITRTSKQGDSAEFSCHVVGNYYRSPISFHQSQKTVHRVHVLILQSIDLAMSQSQVGKRCCRRRGEKRTSQRK